jgi:hypothetical protein
MHGVWRSIAARAAVAASARVVARLGKRASATTSQAHRVAMTSETVARAMGVALWCVARWATAVIAAISLAVPVANRATVRAWTRIARRGSIVASARPAFCPVVATTIGPRRARLTARWFVSRLVSRLVSPVLARVVTAIRARLVPGVGSRVPRAFRPAARLVRTEAGVAPVLATRRLAVGRTSLTVTRSDAAVARVAIGTRASRLGPWRTVAMVGGGVERARFRIASRLTALVAFGLTLGQGGARLGTTTAHRRTCVLGGAAHARRPLLQLESRHR